MLLPGRMAHGSSTAVAVLLLYCKGFEKQAGDETREAGRCQDTNTTQHLPHGGGGRFHRVASHFGGRTANQEDAPCPRGGIIDDLQQG